ncbi:MAG: hypothetical protein SRB2_00749 [Desulfobacteraceae bacterium Eth-SRB2]|nr:MAG: hypothetical protein SRB2_00749 [Desulfobacteraceae bacterium Eth-SRB2]
MEQGLNIEGRGEVDVTDLVRNSLRDASGLIIVWARLEVRKPLIYAAGYEYRT